MVEYLVIKSRKNPFNKPIILNKNDQVDCGEEYKDNENWPGWIWCKTENNEGWVPKQIIKRNCDRGVVLEDYDATEFDIDENEIVIMEKKLNGWIWGYKKGSPNDKAWAPLDHLEEMRAVV